MKKLKINIEHTFIKNTDKQRSRTYSNVSKILHNSEGIFESFIKKELGLNLKHPISCAMTMCGVDKIKSLNNNYRNKNKKTDVLSFPIFDLLADEQPISPTELGDIFICYPVAKSQASSLEVTLENEIVHLFVHGFLHLLGFDHERSSKDEKIMMKWEDYLIKKIHKKWK